MTDKTEIKEGKISHERCGCTREDFIDSIRYLGRNEQQILLKQGYVEADCESCGTEYKIEGEEFQKIMKDILENTYMCSDVMCNTCDVGCFDDSIL